MTDDDATKRYGPIVWQDESAVVRINERRITVHRKNGKGEELLPRGYIVGGNMLYLPEVPMD